MRAVYIVPLVWVVAFAITLPVVSRYSAQALSEQVQKERQIVDLRLQLAQQTRVLQQMEQDAQFVQLAEGFVDKAHQLGVSDRGVTQYPVRYHEIVSPDEVASELARLRGEPERFYLPQSFYLGREGLSLSNNFGRQSESLAEARTQRYLLSYQGRALVINNEN